MSFFIWRSCQMEVSLVGVQGENNYIYSASFCLSQHHVTDGKD